MAGLSAALEAKKANLNFVVFEAAETFSTIANFTNRKPIFTYPTDMQPAGELRLTATVKEDLLMELRSQAASSNITFEIRRVEQVRRKSQLLEVHFEDGTQVKAKHVLLCTGRSGDHRKLGVPGEELDKVHNRLFDPLDYKGLQVLVVGGGDTALETAISLTEADAFVTLSYRGEEFSRPKPENIEKAKEVIGNGLLLETQVKQIKPDSVVLEGQRGDFELPNEAVFVMIGREAPVELLNRSGINLLGRWTATKLIGFVAAFFSVLLVYRWKTENSEIADVFLENGWFSL